MCSKIESVCRVVTSTSKHTHVVCTGVGRAWIFFRLAFFSAHEPSSGAPGATYKWQNNREIKIRTLVVIRANWTLWMWFRHADRVQPKIYTNIASNGSTNYSLQARWTFHFVDRRYGTQTFDRILKLKKKRKKHKQSTLWMYEIVHFISNNITCANFKGLWHYRCHHQCHHQRQINSSGVLIHWNTHAHMITRHALTAFTLHLNWIKIK